MPNLFVVYTSPMSDEQDAAYNDWYTNIHLGEIVALDGIASATRYKVAPMSADGAKHQYLAIYELEDGATPETVSATLGAAMQGGTLQRTDTLRVDADPAGAQSFWQQITDRVTPA